MKRDEIFKKILVGTIALFLFSYLLYQVYKIAYNPLKTEVTTQYSAVEGIPSTVMIIRDEIVLNAASGGNMISVVKDGSRVASNQEVALIFADQEEAGNYMAMLKAKDETERLKKLMARGTVYNLDMDKLNKNLGDKYTQYIDCVMSQNLDLSAYAANDIKGSLISKKMIVGEKIDIASTLSEANKKYNDALQHKSNYTSIKATTSGYYISGVDGFENNVSYKNVKSMEIDEINKAFELPPAKVSEQSIGKLVSSFDWYMICIIDKNKAVNLPLNSSMKISFPHSSVESVNVKLIKKTAENDKKVALIFQGNLMDENIAKLRLEDAQIVIKEIYGIRVNSKAVRTNDKGEQGVFVLNGNNLQFKKLDTLYSAKDYVISKPHDFEKEYVSLYDNVVIGGKNLYEGKVVR